MHRIIVSQNFHGMFGVVAQAQTSQGVDHQLKTNPHVAAARSSGLKIFVTRELSDDEDNAFRCRWNNEQQMAVLSAAAPDLLETLQRIAEGKVMQGEFSHAETVLAYQELARAAIAKAKGEA